MARVSPGGEASEQKPLWKRLGAPAHAAKLPAVLFGSFRSTSFSSFCISRERNFLGDAERSRALGVSDRVSSAGCCGASSSPSSYSGTQSRSTSFRCLHPSPRMFQSRLVPDLIRCIRVYLERVLEEQVSSSLTIIDVPKQALADPDGLVGLSCDPQEVCVLCEFEDRSFPPDVSSLGNWNNRSTS
eukprot:2161535-Rhodomonas_salina.1